MQGPSHSLVHIQEGIAAGDAQSGSGSPGSSDRIRHLGLLVVVRVCCVSFLILLGYQLVQFRPWTAEVPGEDPGEAARRREVTAKQLPERMAFEMRQLGVPAGSSASQLSLLGPQGPSGELAGAGLLLAVLG